MNKIIGCVLAGGKSSRMGKNKALMLYKGKRLVDHMADLLDSLKVDEIIISGKIQSKYQDIEDEIPDLGPIGGIISVLLSHQVQNANMIIFAPVDMPLLNTKLIEELLVIKNKTNKQAACFDHYPLPLLLKISKNLISLAEEIKENGKSISVKQFLRQLNTDYIIIPDREKNSLINVNDKETFEKI